MNVESSHVPKNNGVVLQGITVRRPEEKVVPTIYMERFYEDYLEGRDMDDILEEFIEIYEEQDAAQMPDFEFRADELAPEDVSHQRSSPLGSKRPCVPGI